MKLRNKKTGEIADYNPTLERWNGPSKEIKHYTSLAKLNEEWEDYEEPKDFYIVEQRGTVGSRFRTGDEYEKKFKQIGNYFETEEEAEKAVEKLKAWKRLKDKGFRFDGWDENHHNLGIIEFSFSDVEKSVYDFGDDLDLLFSGGEE